MTDKELYEKITDASKTIFSYCMAKTGSNQMAASRRYCCILLSFAINSSLKHYCGFFKQKTPDIVERLELVEGFEPSAY